MLARQLRNEERDCAFLKSSFCFNALVLLLVLRWEDSGSGAFGDPG